MSVDERQRHQLYNRMVEVLGSEAADTMMGLLPPVGWADVATKRDLELLRSDLRAEMERSLRRVIHWNVGTLIALTGIVLAIVRLT